MSVSIRWRGMKECRQLLRDLTDKTDDPTPLMGKIARYGVISTVNRVADEKHGPKGETWAGYKDPHHAARKSRRSSGGLLEYSGLLLSTMTSEHDRDSARWGSPMEYAARQHFGGGGVVARPFIGLSLQDGNVINQYIREYYDH